MQNWSNSNEIRHKSFKNLQKISKLVQEPLNSTRLTKNESRWANMSRKVLYTKSCIFFKRINLALVLCGAKWRKWAKNGFFWPKMDLHSENRVIIHHYTNFNLPCNKRPDGVMVIVFRSNFPWFCAIWSGVGSIPPSGTWFFFLCSIWLF